MDNLFLFNGIVQGMEEAGFRLLGFDIPSITIRFKDETTVDKSKQRRNAVLAFKEVLGITCIIEEKTNDKNIQSQELDATKQIEVNTFI